MSSYYHRNWRLLLKTFEARLINWTNLLYQQEYDLSGFWFIFLAHLLLFRQYSIVIKGTMSLCAIIFAIQHARSMRLSFTTMKMCVVNRKHAHLIGLVVQFVLTNIILGNSLAMATNCALARSWFACTLFRCSTLCTRNVSQCHKHCWHSWNLLIESCQMPYKHQNS